MQTADLDDFASSSAPDVTVPEDAPTISEVARAIRRLKNGRAAGSDGITAELLKGAEKPSARPCTNCSSPCGPQEECLLNGRKVSLYHYTRARGLTPYAVAYAI